MVYRTGILLLFLIMSLSSTGRAETRWGYLYWGQDYWYAAPLTISAAANPNGAINPVGNIVVPYGDDQSFLITPDSGYYTSEVLVDSVPVGQVPGYSFINVLTNHAIEAFFADLMAPYTPYVTGDFVNGMRITGTTLELATSPFEDPGDNNDHASSHWRVRRTDQPFAPGDTDVSDSDLTGYILEGLVSGLRYVWQVRYEDSSGAISPWSEEYEFLVGSEETDTSVNTAGGINLADYAMVSFNHWPLDPSSVAVFGDEFGDYDPFYFRFGGYSAVTGSYTEFGPGLEIVPGRAYWVLSRNPLNVSVDGVEVSLGEDIEIQLEFNGLPEPDNGWNMVGPPNSADYYWGDVEVVVYDSDGLVVFSGMIASLAEPNDYIDTLLWRWENGTYVSYTPAEAPVMEANNGYWVQAKQAYVSLRFPAAAQIAQAGSLSPMQMIVRNLNNGMLRLKRFLNAETAVAADGDTPPMPMGALTGNTASAGNGGGGGGGCFVASTACNGNPETRAIIAVGVLLSVFTLIAGGVACVVKAMQGNSKLDISRKQNEPNGS